MGYEWIAAVAEGALQGASGFVQHPVKTKRYNKELAVFNNNLARENWEMQNAYDAPAAQMQRYKEAGLNPNLIYGQQNTSGAIQSGSASWSDDMVPHEGKALAAAGNAIAAYQDIVSRQQQIDNAKVYGDILRENAKGKAIDNEVKSATKGYQIEIMAAKTAREQFKQNYSDIVGLQKDRAALNTEYAKYEKLMADTSLSEAKREEVREKMINLRRQRELMDFQMKQLYASTAAIVQNTKFQAQLQPYRLAGIGIQNRNALIQGGILGKEFNWYDTIKMDQHMNSIWNGPDLWKIPGAFMKGLDSYLKSLGVNF